MTAPREFLFVYGTLRAEVAHPMASMVATHAERIGRAYFRGRLYDLGDYPGAVGSSLPSDRVVGELHRIEPGQQAALLAELGRYEGWNPDRPSESEFVRVRAWIESESGDRVEAWIYTYNRPTECLARIVSGDFTSVSGANRTAGNAPDLSA